MSRITTSCQRLPHHVNDYHIMSTINTSCGQVKRRQSSHLWYDNHELDNARRQVQSCTDKYGVSSWQHTDAITNMEALHASAAAKAASEIIDEIGGRLESNKPTDWQEIQAI